MAKEMIFSSAKKTVYRDGDTAIKEFCEGFPKAEVLNEALCNARVETIEALNVPKGLGVTVTDGQWSIIKEYVPGKTLEQLMDENIREETARETAPSSQQIFYIIYCINHKSKFGCPFSID